jgi:hypothetical protein
VLFCTLENLEQEAKLRAIIEISKAERIKVGKVKVFLQIWNGKVVNPKTSS